MTAKSFVTRMCDVHVVIVLVSLPLSLQLSWSSLVVLCVWEISLDLKGLLAFSVILVMFINIFIFPCFLDIIYKVMSVLLCMRKQKNGCVLLAEGSLWEAVLPILLTWYCYTILQKIKSDDNTRCLLFLYLWSVAINQFATCISFIKHPMIWKMM